MALSQWLRQLAQWLTGLFQKTPKKQELPSQDAPPGITFYTVYIPTLNGRFSYLGIDTYVPGDVVVIPFGPEDKQIFGIVEKVQTHPYGKTPLPMWKMKYILGKAPQAIIEEYRRLKKD